MSYNQLLIVCFAIICTNFICQVLLSADHIAVILRVAYWQKHEKA